MDELAPLYTHPNGAPTKEEALQFALMVMSGMPPFEVIRYFYPDSEESELKLALKQWTRSHRVREALLGQQNGKTWQGMSLSERIDFSIQKHYSEMAYFLFSHNYSTLVGPDKLKADTCRTALEAKIAGTAGQMTPLEKFWDDIRTGKVTLTPPAGSRKDPPPSSSIKVGSA